ncbi:uncharacterized protein LOC108595186 [Drosophila busckii]|uniref:uncharacterized protein LOC108595186 n=1 Tax=Drosophila busckii TaxID=30019 RepID=UPI001432F47F|nr:uncharacterized protein LOC108595186 [Drosophila busckii]
MDKGWKIQTASERQRSKNADFLLNFFLDEGLGTQLTQAIQLMISEDKGNVFKNKVEQAGHIQSSLPRYQDDQFNEQFGIKRSSFDKLLQVVGNAIASAVHVQPNLQISLSDKLLYKLMLIGSKKFFRDVGEWFGISKNSGHETSAFASLLPRYIKWSADNVCHQLVISNLPGVVDIIDELCIPLKRSVYDNHGQHKYTTLALQAVCDNRSYFVDVHIDVPVIQSVLLKSELFERLIDKQKPLVPPDKHIVG